jgi:hypothetical protein
MRTEEIKIYTFDELSDEAKEKAREWYRRGALDYEWWDYVYENAARCGIKITGFDIDRGDISGERKGTFLDTAHAIIKEHGETCETHKTAQAFIAEVTPLEKELEDAEGKDEAMAKLRQLGDKISRLEDDFFHEILECYLIMLRNEANYLLSDEQVDESILSNGYEFTEDGNRNVLKKAKLFYFTMENEP